MPGLHCPGTRRSDEVDITPVRLAASIGLLGDKLARPLPKRGGFGCSVLTME